jgi:enoyl-CoA hydratase/carnithine racemase
MNTDLVLCDIDDGVATVTLNNPPMNLVTVPLTLALGDTLGRLRADDGVRAVVMTGAGDRAFCAGSDISEFSGMMAPGLVLDKKLTRQNVIFGGLDDFPKPTIAAIAGLAYGGGLEIAACCDLIVAEEHSRLCLPEIKLGVFPSSGGPVRVTRRIGEGRAKEMMFFGEPIDAPTALAWGLVNRVVPTGRGLKTAQEMAVVLTRRPRGALRRVKTAIDLTFELCEDEVIARSLLMSDEAFSSDECKEGVRAFFAKTPPDFRKL